MDKVFTFPHAGGEFLYVNCSGLKKDGTRLISLMDEMRGRIEKPSMTKNVAFHVYDTAVDDRLAGEIARRLKTAESDIRRIAFIGLSRFGRRRITRHLKAQKLGVPTAYLFDINRAKDWLVG